MRLPSEMRFPPLLVEVLRRPTSGGFLCIGWPLLWPGAPFSRPGSAKHLDGGIALPGHVRSCYQPADCRTAPDRRQWVDTTLLRRTIQRQLSPKRSLASGEAAARTGHDLLISKHPAIGSNMRIADMRESRRADARSVQARMAANGRIRLGRHLPMIVAAPVGNLEQAVEAVSSTSISYSPWLELDEIVSMLGKLLATGLAG